MRKCTPFGFTLIELLIVISIIAILSTITIQNFSDTREKALFITAKKELQSVADSLELYLHDYGSYPADTNRDIPPGLEHYLSPGLWPDAAWKGSVFDWENWTNPNTGEPIYQISIRFCPIGEPESCNFPEQDWASDFDINSSVYYCIKGACRSHINKPEDHPGYCVNCNQ